VPDGEAALEAIRQHPPDLVLTDVMMPKLDGFGLLKELRSDERTETIPVIMLSARAGEESRVEGLSAGADDYLIKPFSARELLARVNSHLKMARIRREAARVERKLRAEAELERSRLHDLFMQAPAAIGFLSGPQHRFTFVNLDWIKVTGRRRVEDFIGKTVREALPELEGQGLLELLDGVYRTGAPFIGTARKVTLNRGLNAQPEEVYFDFVYQPMRGTTGEVEGILIHGVDVTQAERANNLLASIVGSSDDAIVSKSLDGIITSWNNAAERIFGYTPEEAVGKHISLIIPADRQDEEIGILRRIRTGNRVDHFETVRQRKDGTLIDISATISPVKDSTGRIIGASKVARDISQRMQSEIALRQSEERFRKLAETLDAEVRARTEELEQRNGEVLTQAEQVRQLSWQLLRTQDEERRHIARELHDSAGQTLAVLGMNLATIIENARKQAPDIVETAEQTHEILEELTKEIRTTSYLLHPPLLDENGLPAALSWYIRGLSERSGLDIAFSISEEFGRLPRDMELVVFRLVQEGLTNIHRHSGSKRAIIRIVRDSDRVLIEVRDQGKGIPKEKLAQIQYGRAGVGIRGMRERLRQFQGEMILDSTGSGTTVVVTIPVSREIASSKANEEPLESAV
jgi:PAS domain S-box-containing protein